MDFETETVACLCGATRDDRSREARCDLNGVIFHFTYLRCAACGVERVSPRPRSHEIGRFYTDTYASHVVREEGAASRMKRLIRDVFHMPANRFGAFRPVLRLLLWPLRGHTVFAFTPTEPRLVFEFGAATGNDLVNFRAEGWQVSGCEPSARVAAIAAERGIVLQNVPAEAVELMPASVSCVLINNVLEHTHAPDAVLRTALAGLVPGGSLVVVVPNHAGPAARLFGAAWPGYDAPRHLWGFTPASLVRLMRETGFEAPIVYPMVQGRWAWLSTIEGRNAAEQPAAWRRRWARPLSLPLLAMGIVALVFGKGDFMTVVARRPQE